MPGTNLSRLSPLVLVILVLVILVRVGVVMVLVQTIQSRTVRTARALESELDGPLLKHPDAPKFIAHAKASYRDVCKADWVEATKGYAGMLDETLTSVSWERLATLWHCFLRLCNAQNAPRPFDKPTLWNFLRSAVTETEVLARKNGLLDEDGRLAKTWQERCREIHKTACTSRRCVALDSGRTVIELNVNGSTPNERRPWQRQAARTPIRRSRPPRGPRFGNALATSRRCQHEETITR